MGKRGPKPKEKNEIGRRVVFYAQKPCDDALTRWKPFANKKISPVICAAMQLAERHPEEFLEILNSPPPSSE